MRRTIAARAVLELGAEGDGDGALGVENAKTSRGPTGSGGEEEGEGEREFPQTTVADGGPRCC
jgi:hypothetical protein